VKVFRFDDQFIAACNLEEATAEYVAIFSQSEPPIVGVELTDAEMDAIKVTQLDEDDVPTGEFQTIRQELAAWGDAEDSDAQYLCGVE
jgi:hypothetical protein